MRQEEDMKRIGRRAPQQGKKAAFKSNRYLIDAWKLLSTDLTASRYAHSLDAMRHSQSEAPRWCEALITRLVAHGMHPCTTHLSGTKDSK